MISAFFATLLILVLASTPAPVRAEESAFFLGGIVHDVKSQPIPGVLVLSSSVKTGVPVNSAGAPFYSGIRKGGGDFEVAGDFTDAEGGFEIAVPPGSYNLIAQKWIDPDRAWDSAMGEINLIEQYGETVALCGHALEIDHPSSTTLTVYFYDPKWETSETFDFPVSDGSTSALKSTGTGAIQAEVETGNDETLIILSTSPPALDPIFGFHAWEGNFLRNMIGFNRMPDGKTTFLNVPEGTLYLAAFANDNRPGFAHESVEVSPGETSSINMQFVADWSNARHTPPDSLMPLYSKIKTNGWKMRDIPAMGEIIGKARAEDSIIRLLQYPEIARQAIILPDDSQATFKDIFTVFQYLDKWPHA